MSIKSPIRLALCTAIMGVATTALVFRTQLEARQLERTRDEARAMLLHTVALYFRADITMSGDQVQAFCSRLVDHSAILAACVWDQTRLRIGCAGRNEELLRLVSRDAAPTSQTARGGELPWPLLRANVDLGHDFRSGRPARLALVLDASRLPGSGATNAWAFTLYILAVGGGVWIVAAKWVDRTVIDPLAGLAELAASESAAADDAGLFVRKDEVGRIARAMIRLRDEAKSWRDQARRSERRLDSKVAEESRRLARELKRFQRAAWQDHLTGVYNRRLFEEKFSQVFAAQSAVGADLSLVMLDLDHFKHVNDTCGHATGDEILAFVGELLRQCLRAEDLAVRYGGDEFVLILPGIGADGAHQLVLRIMALFAQRAKMLACAVPPPSMTAGIASLRNDRPASPTAMLRLVDGAMYEAKRRGRRRVLLARDVARVGA